MTRPMLLTEARWGLPVLVAAGLVAAIAPAGQLGEWTLWVIQGVLALSLVLVWGMGGIFSFGQAALYGIGGYAYGIVAINVGASGETGSALLVAAAVSAAFAAVLGYFMFYGRVGDIYVAIITLASTLVLFSFVNNTADPRWRIGEAKIGGTNGLVGIPSFRLGLFGVGGVDLTSRWFFVFCAVVAVLAALLVRRVLARPFGRITVAVRSNELRTELLGYDTRRYKLLLFVLGGAIAGLAGGMFAAWGRFMSPTSVFTLGPAALVVIWVLVGSRTSVLGAFLGVLVVESLTSLIGGSQGQNSPIYLGAALILIVLFLREGLVHSVAAWVRRRRGATEPVPDELAGSAADDEPEVDALPVEGERPFTVLKGTQLNKWFGGLRAVHDVTLEFPARGVTCLLGPNGAGKSTLFSLLTGHQSVTTGRVLLGQADVTHALPHERARQGIGIKLQVASIYADLSTRENLWLATYARHRDADRADERADALLHWLGLGHRADIEAGTLSHGEQQWLEIGMVVATEPSVVLLDEPTAGMTRDETARTARLVTELATHASVVVVEHDMAFVRQLDAPAIMLHMGSVFARGSLAELEKDERILDIYLGRSHVVA